MADVSKQQPQQQQAQQQPSQQAQAAQPTPQQQSQQAASGQSQPMEGQVQVQVQLTHDATQQMHSQQQQVQAPASATQGMIPTSTMVMSTPQQTLQQQQIMQNMQSPPAIAPMPAQSGSTTITTMSTLGQQQQMADWSNHGRVQVIQQQLQNPTAYVQQVYNPQGQLIMPGNIALHPGMNQGPIQVITTGKAFQPGQMPHTMLTTAQGKQLVQGQPTSFPGYIPTSGNNQQTLVISQLGVQHILPQQQQQPQQQQKQDLNKQYTCATPNSQRPQPNQITAAAAAAAAQNAAAAAAAMQFAPWQATFGPATATGLPQGLTWATATPAGTLQSPATTALLTAQGNQIFIRGPGQPGDQSGGMFLHGGTTGGPGTTAGTAGQLGTAMAGQAITAKAPQQVELQSNAGQPQSQPQQQPAAKAAIPKTFSNILPNSVGPQLIRPASSVSTQTGQTQTHLHQSNLHAHKSGAKVRTKTVVSRTGPSMTIQKMDAANQTVKGSLQSKTPPQMATDQEKLFRTIQQQHQQQQQHLIAVHQQQQMQQQIFQQQLQGKQVLMSGAIPAGHLVATATGADGRPVMPVVSMQPTTAQGIAVGQMMVQTVDQVQAFSQGVQMIAPPITMKLEDTPPKEETTTIEEPSAAGPGRPEDSKSESTGGPVPTTDLAQTSQVPSAASIDGQQSPLTASLPTTSSTPTVVTTTVSTAPSVGGDNGSDKENVEKAGPPKAMVKPQVLTHVIEGFVIQESSEPFAVNRGIHHEIFDKGVPVANGTASRQLSGSAYEPPKKKQALGEAPNSNNEKQLAKCEMCGKVDLKSKFKQSKRFCSLPCAKRYNVGCSARVGLFAADEEKESTSSPDESTGPDEPETPKINPVKWTVAEVCDFIRQLPGCAEYVDDFAMQEIDGQALMLLKEDHLMSAMSIKLGPALKIVAKIDAMRGDVPAAATPSGTAVKEPAGSPPK